jgi:putative addiction module component (TIGR02574 family)
MTKHQILSEAMTLDARDRDEVAEALWQSAEPGEFTSQQIAEIHRRVAALDAGEVQSIPGEQVMQELRRRLQR